MSQSQPNNPLHGITLEQVVLKLVEHYGWVGLAQRIDINCFKSEPSVKSSLKFLRKTPWARDKVEALYIATFSGTATSPTGSRGSGQRNTGPRSSGPRSSSAAPVKPHPDNPWARVKKR